MKLFTLVSLLLAANSAFAIESLYLVNNNVGKTQTQLSYIRQNSQFDYIQAETEELGRGTAAINQWRLGFNHAFSELTTLSAGFKFVTSTVKNQTSFNSFDANGLGDIDMTIKAGTVFEALTLTYGGAITLSPGPAEDASTVFNNKGQVISSRGNQFSGYNTISGFAGSESYVGEVAVGAKLSLDHYTQQNKADGFGGTMVAQLPKTGFGLSAYAELPIFKQIDVGMAAGVQRTDFNGAKVFNREDGTLNQSRVYTNFRYDKATMVSLVLSQEEDNKLNHESTTGVGLTLQKAL
jgi:hypothetical protein